MTGGTLKLAPRIKLHLYRYSTLIRGFEGACRTSSVRLMHAWGGDAVVLAEWRVWYYLLQSYLAQGVDAEVLLLFMLALVQPYHVDVNRQVEHPVHRPKEPRGSDVCCAERA